MGNISRTTELLYLAGCKHCSYLKPSRHKEVVAKKSSHQRHLSKKELRFRVPNRRLQAGMESVTKSLFNQKYCFNSFMAIVIFILFFFLLEVPTPNKEIYGGSLS